MAASNSYLIQILLPLKDNKGKAFPASKYTQVQHELTEKFGGVTSHVRSPAKGRWEKDDEVMHDDIVMIEVMTETLNTAWWKRYKKQLEKTFLQHELIIRAQRSLMF